MYQLYGLTPAKIVVPIGAYTNTSLKGAPMMVMEAAYPADVYKRLEVTAPFGVGNQSYDMQALPASFIYELYSIGFSYTGGTITINKLTIHSGVQTFLLGGTAALAQNVVQVWNGKIIVAAGDSVRIDFTVTVASPTITISALGYRKELIT